MAVNVLRTDVNTTITTTVFLYLDYYKKLLLKFLDGEDKVTLEQGIMTCRDNRDISQPFF